MKYNFLQKRSSVDNTDLEIPVLKSQLCCCCTGTVQNRRSSTHIFGEDEVGFEVAMRVLRLRDPVSEGAVGLVPVNAHVARRVVDQIVHVVAQLPGSTAASWYTERVGSILEANSECHMLYACVLSGYIRE
jgi:hypothetical protein